MSVFSNAKPWIIVYGDEGDGSGAGGESGGEGDSGGETKPSLKTLVEKHGLQEELNTMMATNRKTLTTKNQELVTQLTQLRDQESMSTQAKEELEARIEEIQTQYMSKEELAKREAGKADKAHAVEVEKLTGDASRWQGLYATSTTQRSLLDAAVEGEAIQPSQIVSMLGTNTHIVEELNGAGQGKGTYKTLVKFNDIDTEGNPVVLDLSPREAIKRMKELPEMYGNLFKGDAAGGLGGGAGVGAGGGGDKAAKLKDILSDPVRYQKWRKENPDLDISKLRK